MRLSLVLRLILALIFAAFAAIFSVLIPPIDGLNPILIKVFITAAAAFLGYVIFPNVTKSVRVISLTLFNLVVNRVTTELMSQILRLPRARLPFGTQTPQVGQVSITKPLILDTSAIIDGRVLDVAKTGFISGLVLVPRFVLTELQQVSDSGDDLKRQRGRRGFDVLENLKKVKGIKVEVWDKEQNGKAVDDKLVNLAKSLNGKILTCDFNLNKVASLAGAGVLNINDLANSVKTIALPGESLDLKMVHLGKDSRQGVGYLPDGTMVVVEDGAESLGQIIKVEVTKVLQIPQGRMIFGKKA